jgi:hypothetical protein
MGLIGSEHLRYTPLVTTIRPIDSDINRNEARRLQRLAASNDIKWNTLMAKS